MMRKTDEAKTIVGDGGAVEFSPAWKYRDAVRKIVEEHLASAEKRRERVRETNARASIFGIRTSA